jgi:dimethylaniline monooxygenase (N-oxide forming)
MLTLPSSCGYAARMSRYPTAAVIGAGSSGIAAAKALRERGVPVTVFEASDRVGGNWVFGNRNGMSAAYRGLHINTSRDRMEFSDFPMSRSCPDYPHHTQIATYFDAYVDHFGFRDAIRFETTVRTARRGDDGVWELELGDGTVERFDALLVANGHHWDPRWPEPMFPGHETFSGTQIHAHDYRDSDLFAGRRALILGMGNSAMDIAVEASYVAERTFLAARRGAWILPKYLFGRPVDQLPNDPRLPVKLRMKVFEAMIRLHVGSPEKYGLPRPDHPFGAAHPTVSGRIIDRLQHGAITPKPNIARLEGDTVEFTDGSRERVDVVVYCTGYRISFPFFDPTLIAAPDNRIELFRRVMHPDIDNVFFVALVQPLGAIMPIAERQAQWIADHLRGEYLRPGRSAMLRDIRAENDAMRRRYVASKRHTIQVDFDDYLRDLERERRAGAQRARAAGFPLPIAPVTTTAAAAADPSDDAGIAA